MISTMPLAFLSDEFGWRPPFIIIGILSLFLGIVMFYFARDRPKDMGFESIHEHRERMSNSNVFKGFVKIIET